MDQDEKKKGYGTHYECKDCMGICMAAVTGVCACGRYKSYSFFALCRVCAKEQNVCNICGTSKE